MTNRYSSTNQAIAQAIRDAIMEDRVPVLEPASEHEERALCDELSMESDDSAETETETEFWGQDIDGNTWRVHVARVAGAE